MRRLMTQLRTGSAQLRRVCSFRMMGKRVGGSQTDLTPRTDTQFLLVAPPPLSFPTLYKLSPFAYLGISNIYVCLKYLNRGLGFGVWGLGFGVWGLGFG